MWRLRVGKFLSLFFLFRVDIFLTMFFVALLGLAYFHLCFFGLGLAYFYLCFLMPKGWHTFMSTESNQVPVSQWAQPTSTAFKRSLWVDIPTAQTTGVIAVWLILFSSRKGWRVKKSETIMKSIWREISVLLSEIKKKTKTMSKRMLIRLV